MKLLGEDNLYAFLHTIYKVPLNMDQGNPNFIREKLEPEHKKVFVVSI